MTFYFHPEAESKLIESIDYYENRVLGIGEDFAGEVYTPSEILCPIPLRGRLLKVRYEGQIGDGQIGDVVDYLYLFIFFLSITLATADVETPISRATSANDNPNSSVNRKESSCRTLDI
jgi:hypothetical protein